MLARVIVAFLAVHFFVVRVLDTFFTTEFFLTHFLLGCKESVGLDLTVHVLSLLDSSIVMLASTILIGTLDKQAVPKISFNSSSTAAQLTWSCCRSQEDRHKVVI